MKVQRTHIFNLFILLTIILTSCGMNPDAESDIATAVAQTVEAQSALTKVASPPTLTPAPTLDLAATPLMTPTSTKSASASATNPGCDPAAALISEFPPDRTVFKPGEYFFKTWTFQNTGTCAWDTDYKLVFWSGDTIGGSASYNFSEYVLPGSTMEISIYLQAPQTEGVIAGYWRLQTPWGDDFGVGQYDQSFYVEINVSNEKEFGITSVTYELVRNPTFGCPTNVEYLVYATVSVSGPYRFTWYWDQSDGNRSGNTRMIFTDAGSQTVKRRWLIGKGSSQTPRWVEFVLNEPDLVRRYGKVTILNTCN